MCAIKVSNLTKIFQISTPGAGLFGAFCRRKSELNAVDGISFEIAAGERVAFIGPNGAGKSTTIKMLCGILVPSAGEISVLGFTPWKQREALSYKVGIVFGNRSQLWSHLPVRDSFELLGEIYARESGEHRQRVGELCDLLEVNRLLESPVNKLSLGERMRCELVASLLHKPAVLFLDEPTIGLDVAARALLREYIKRISQNEQVTILLTSHDTGDIEEVCDRVVVINHGTLILDRPIGELRRGFINRKRITVTTEGNNSVSAREGVEIINLDEITWQLDVDTAISSVDAVVRGLVTETNLVDLTIEDPPLDETILQIYRENRIKKGGDLR